MSSPKLPPLTAIPMDTMNKSASLQKPLTPDGINTTLGALKMITMANTAKQRSDTLPQPNSRNNSLPTITPLQGLTPITPVDYDDNDKMEYTPPSIHHLHGCNTKNGESQADFSTNGNAAVTKEILGINNGGSNGTTQSRRSTLHSLGFSPFDPTDITTIHPIEINKALNITMMPQMAQTNSFQQEHIAPFAKGLKGNQSHSDLTRRVSNTFSSLQHRYNGQQIALQLQNSLSAGKVDKDDKKEIEIIRRVPCSEGCVENICLNSDFWWNKYNIFRMLMLFVAAVFLIVCVFYAIGQLSRLEVDDYLCDNQLDLNDIYQHNKKEHNVGGERNKSCFTTEKGIIDEYKLYKSRDVAYRAVFDINAINIGKMLSFLMVAMFLLFLILMIHCIKLWNDLRRFYFNAWLYIYFKQKRSASTAPNKYEMCWKNCVDCVVNNKCIKFYKYYLSADRIGWVFYLMFREIVEVAIQTMALLKYGGFNRMHDLDVGDENGLNLAEKSIYLIIFSIFLTLNCLTVGVIWSFYICFHDSFQGRYFNGVILMIDSIFDIFYSLFPLIIRNQIHFSSFQSYSLIGYLSMMIPLIFLTSKMFTVLNYLSSKSRKDWRLLFDERLWYKMQCELAKIDPHKHDSLSQVAIATNPVKSTHHAFVGHNLKQCVIDEEENENAANETPVSNETPVPNDNENKQQPQARKRCLIHCCKSICYGPKYLQSPLPDRHYSPAKFCIQVVRRAIVLCYGFILILYGTALIVYISNHFSASHDICSTEMLWKYCTHKVYPFVFGDTDNFYPCQCRSFFMDRDDFIQNEHIFADNSNVFESLFEHWSMLQMIVLHAPHSNNMSAGIVLDPSKMQSHGLRILSIKNLAVRVNEAKNLFLIWNKMQLLQIDNGLQLNAEEKRLQLSDNLKYLSLIGSNLISIGSPSNLQYLSLENCTNLLQTLFPFDGITNLKYLNLVNVNLFNISLLFHISPLRQYIHYFGDIAAHDMRNIDAFQTNIDTKYYLQATPLCAEYRANASAIAASIKNWIQKTNACRLPFDDDDLADNKLNLCPPTKWMNGICNEHCNNALMQFDGGDCAQYP